MPRLDGSSVADFRSRGCSLCSMSAHIPAGGLARTRPKLGKSDGGKSFVYHPKHGVKGEGMNKLASTRAGSKGGFTDRVYVAARLNWDAFDNVRKALYIRIERYKSKQITLDFLQTQVILPNGIAPLIALVKRYQAQGVKFTVMPPRSVDLNKLARFEGWFHAVDPDRFNPPNATGYNSLPLRQFTNDTELNAGVNDAIEVALRNCTMAKNVAGAFEWTLNELAGNVLHHAQTEIGLIQVNTFPKNNVLSIIVADSGIGIPKSLRERFPEIDNDRIAVEQAVQKGVTSKPTFGQGNGLAGSVAISVQSHAFFSITSGGGRLTVENGVTAVRDFFPPLYGTVVEMQLPTDREIDLPAALWGHDPSTYVEEKFEVAPDTLHLKLKDCAQTFGNRITGVKVRTLIENLLAQSEKAELEISFENVNMIASSFADEVFGKLFLKMGPLGFTSRIRFNSLNGTCRHLIDAAITERMMQGSGD